MKVFEVTENNCWKFLIVILAFALFLRLYFQSGIIGSGDVFHTIYAHQIVNGSYHPTPQDVHYSTRIAFIYPMAFFFKIFGVNEASSYLFSLITSLLGIPLIYFLGTFFFDRKIGILSAFLLSFYPLDVINASAALPDIPHSFFMGVSILLFFVGRNQALTFKKVFSYLACGICIGIAYYMKTSALLVFVFLLFFGLYELLIIKRNLKFIKRFEWNYLFVFLGFVIAYLLGLALIYHASGDPFLSEKQFDNAYTISQEKLYNYNSGIKLLGRLFLHFPFMMLTNYNFGLFFALVFASSFFYLYLTAKGKSIKKNLFIVILWLYSMLAYINFGPTALSFSNYLLLPATPRYLTVLTYPSLLLAATFISEKKFSKYAKASIFILLLTSLLLIGFYPDRNLRINTKKAHDFFSSENKLNITIYMDAPSYYSYEFYSGYMDLENVALYIRGNEQGGTGSTILANLSQVKDSYVLIDWSMINSIPKNYLWVFPDEIKNPPKSWKMLREIKNPSGNAYIFYAP